MTVVSAHIRQLGQDRVLPAEATTILVLVAVRWLAGILENFGFPALSEIAAIVLLGSLAIIFLNRMRIAEASSLFVTGILAWIISGLLSYAANTDANPQATITLLMLLMLYGLLANAVTTHLRDRACLHILSMVLGMFIAVGFCLSVLQIVTSTGFVEAGKEYIQRAYGSDVHPVSFAIQLVAALVGLEIIRVKLGKKVNVAHIALYCAGFIALYFTYARTAWVMAAVVIALSAVLRGTLARRVFATGLAVLIGSALILSSDRFADLGSLPGFLSAFSTQDVVFDWRLVDNSVSWRIVNWSYGFQQALSQPWLGFGPGQSAVSSYFNLEMHNIFLEVFFEGGVFGLGALLITLSGLVRLHRRLPKFNKADRHCTILANSFGATLILAVTFSTSFVDQLMSFILYYFLLTAATIRV